MPAIRHIIPARMASTKTGKVGGFAQAVALGARICHQGDYAGCRGEYGSPGSASGFMGAIGLPVLQQSGCGIFRMQRIRGQLPEQ